MKLPEGYKLYDGSELPIQKVMKKVGAHSLKVEDEELKQAFETIDCDSGIYNLPLKKYSEKFCGVHSQSVIPQFNSKKNFFERRYYQITDARVYRFKDKFFPLMVEHNQNDIGFRPLPADNMWIEVPLQFGNVQIAGIHLLRVYVNEKDEFSYQVYPNSIRPVGYDTEAISIFVTGVANNVNFYSYFLLEKMGKYDKLKPQGSYACPYCNFPMKRLAKTHAYYCDNEICVLDNQDAEKVVYDMDDYKIKKMFMPMKMKDVWKIEDKIRLFISNFLDYLDEPEVRTYTNISERDLKEQNQRRAKRGKPALPPIRIIEVTGELKRYINLVGKKCRTVNVARNETWVDGHFYRFWDRDHFCGLYEWIKGFKTDDEIIDRLKKMVKKDDKGHPLPQSQQYRWDKRYKVIKVHKRGFIKFKGEGEPVERIKVVDIE